MSRTKPINVHLAVLAFVVLPITASAQVHVQLENAAGGSALVESDTRFAFGCTFQTDQYIDAWLWAQLYLYLDGNLVGTDYTDGYGQIGGAAWANAAATTQNQQVDCYVDSNIGYGSANGYLPGMPDGEITQSGGWYNGGTTHVWNQTLTGGGNYEGRQVVEWNAGGGPDYCWYPGSQIDYADHVTGGQWTVQSGNTWGPDVVGWLPVAVGYYRNHGRSPCDTTMIQDMRIDCPGNGCNSNTVSYVINTLRLGITDTTVWSERAGQYAERIWP